MTMKSFQWKGRMDDSQNWSHYRFHQAVNHEGDYALIGFCCDEGVRRNQGRIGASKAPDAIRHALSSQPWRMPEHLYIMDVGNILCKYQHLEEAQQSLGEVVSQQLEMGKIPLILGGGHETFFGHYLGARQFVGEKKTIGMINIDAHFDLRPYDQETSSGTMFRQILEMDPDVGYCAIGIQRHGNTEALFQTANTFGVQYVLEDELNLTEIEDTLKTFASSYDVVIATICMDVVESSAAPGVSAPSVFGLSPKVMRSIIRMIGKLPKLLSFDISEVNPKFDEDQRTAKLAAALLIELMSAREASETCSKNREI